MEMKTVAVTANEGKEKARSLNVQVPTPANLEEAKAQFGEQVVFDVFLAQYIIKVQAYVRGQLAAEVKETGLPRFSDAEVLESFAAWKLTGGNRSKLTPQDRLKRHFKGMSKEDILAALAELEDSDLMGTEEESDESEPVAEQ